MRAVVILAGLAVLACAPPESPDRTSSGDEAGAIEAGSFDGADYSSEAERLAHGERLAGVLGCNTCHLEDYSGTNFGEVVPLLEGLWASNISRTMPSLSDAELERVLREGVHPEREIYLMPSKQSQFLSARDMQALIAFLRTIEPTGEPTPLPPPGFEAAVTARLPADYWERTMDGQRRYHNSAEEVAYFAANTVPDLGAEHAQGRVVAQTICTSCHGAALDGVGEPSGDVERAVDYDDAEARRLLRDGVRLNGEPIEMPWGTGHVPASLTDGEVDAAIAYTRALVTRR